jgi:NADP-dependent 3-hydroxy acid dehydrogenase YdfG
LAGRDFVSDLEDLTRMCTRMFLDGREADAVEEFNDKVERVMTTLTVKADELDTDVITRLNTFQFNHYMEFVALKNNSGIKKKGGKL